MFLLFYLIFSYLEFPEKQNTVFFFMVKHIMVRDDYEEIGTDLFKDLQIKYHNILSRSHITRGARD